MKLKNLEGDLPGITIATAVFFAAVILLSAFFIHKFGWRYAGIKELDALEKRVEKLELRKI